ncbi:Hypothetical protein R9X50_00721500 [Acrodontium crateriforme]|uniref:L-lactate dehydrogenase (cytochrome) n=1 Tax=Acrodontium crateriforme TaxID=150365 RepID=A0AAQ3R7F5_9PEZI|nr:Hypothetical protein R9X50_00721500 [Acrodontium crateriforme]
MVRKFTFDEIQQHRSAESTWVVLYGKVYDVTSFLPSHPGGTKVILELAGSDATEEYDPIHPPGILEESLPSEALLGEFDASTLPAVEKSEEIKQKSVSASPSQQTADEDDGPSTLQECLSLDDIETLATKQMSAKAWSYYFSASDDLLSKKLNNAVYQDILLRPRIFKDCTRCDTSTQILGHKTKIPLFVSPAAMARLAHPDGEHGIAQACASFGAVQIISNNASQTPEQICADAQPGQIFGWQLYVQQDRAKSEKLLARVNKIPSIKFICLTLDAPVPGKREHDIRGKKVGAKLPVTSSVAPDADAQGTVVDGAGGVGKALFAGTAPDLTWTTTLPWLRQHTSLPIILKGLQTHEDAALAAQHSPMIRGIILSNHGGRAMDTAPPSLHTLMEIRQFSPHVFQKLEIFLDGGIRRGTDVVKALCLGATAVGIGRAPLYGLAAGGKEGVAHLLDILVKEVETAMRLLGCESVDELGPQFVNTRRVERDLYQGPFGGVGRFGDVKSKL